MHWYWIDRFTVFESGKRAQAIKNVSRAEEYAPDHFLYHSVMPASLIIEGLAQTAGLLVHEAKNYEKKVVLGKIARFTFSDVEQVPGDTLIYDAVVDYIHDEGSMLSVTVHKNGKQIAEGALIFAHLGEEFNGRPLYGEDDLFDLFRAFEVYEVGVAADGSRLRDPTLSRS